MSDRLSNFVGGIHVSIFNNKFPIITDQWLPVVIALDDNDKL